MVSAASISESPCSSSAKSLSSLVAESGLEPKLHSWFRVVSITEPPQLFLDVFVSALDWGSEEVKGTEGAVRCSG